MAESNKAPGMPWGWIVFLLVLIAAGVTTFLLLTRHRTANAAPIPDTSPPPGDSSDGYKPITPPIMTFFGPPQRLRHPTGDASEIFGTRMWVHDAGFVVVASDTKLYFYFTNTRGALQYDRTISVTDLLTAEEKTLFALYNVNPVIVSGCFAPSLEDLDQEYYLVLSVGHFIGDYRFGRVLVLMTYDGLRWRTDDFNRLEIPDALFSPFGDTTPEAGATLNPQRAVGQTIKIVVDKTSASGNANHHVYVNATNAIESQPGGSVLWFSIVDGAATFLAQINDSRLQAIYEASGRDDTTIRWPVTPLDYLQSFGAEFLIDSSDSDPDAAVLCVSNLSTEDGKYRDNSTGFWGGKRSAGGYVQVFYRNAENRWEMQNGKLARFVEPDSNAAYKEIGCTLAIVKQGGGIRSLFIGAKTETSFQIFSLPLRQLKSATPSAIPIFVALPAPDTKVTFPSIMPSSGISTGALTSVKMVSLGTKQWVLSVPMDTAAVATQTPLSIVTYDDKKQVFVIVQGIALNNAIGLPSTTTPSNIKSSYSFGQAVGMWESTTGRTDYLAVNDPFENQIWVYARTHSNAA